MFMVWFNYIPTLFLIFLSIILVLILFGVSFFLGSSDSNVDFEKMSTYECGFEPFEDTQGTFDIKFFLLAMLFMVFDLEIMFLLPWTLSFGEVTTCSFFVFSWFFMVLVVAFIYEWLKGALEW